MHQKETIHVFDVDGTLTHHDSLLLLVKWLVPSFVAKVKLGYSVLPVAIYSLFINKPRLLKQALLQKLWMGKTQKALFHLGEQFFEQKLKTDLRSNALAYIQQLSQTDTQIKLVLLSASCQEWLQPLAYYLNADLICTELEYNIQQQFTGQFATPNCKGAEKVKRLLEKYPASEYQFICYADSPSDRPLQTISKQFFYRYF